LLEHNEIYCGDSFELAEQVEDKSIDLILEDMPYNITACKWDVKIDLEKYWESRKRIIKDNGAIVLTASQPFTSVLVVSNLGMFKYCWHWNKGKAKNYLNARKQPMRIIEEIVVFYKNQCSYSPQLSQREKRHIRNNGKTYKATNNGVFGKINPTRKLNEGRIIPIDLKYPDDLLNINGVNSFGFEKTGHPTQKPVELFKYLIKTYTNENDLVFDGFLGSGTTAVACKQLNRNYIGIEKEQKYFEIANKRLLQENLYGKK